MTRETTTGRFWIEKRDRPVKPEGAPDRAVILARQSISKVTSVSLEDQEIHGRRWSEQQGYTVVDVLRSPNIRGWQDDRRDHEAVLGLAVAGRIEVVVAYDTARAARTMRIMEQWAHELERLGVRLEFASAPMANTPMGRQMLTMLAEMETQQRSVRMQDLFADAMTRKGWWHGAVPYGYTRGDHTLGVDDDRADLVRGMFARAADGWGSARIAGWANDQGAVTTGGAPWDRDAVRTVLSNPAYLGHVRRHGEVVHRGAHPAVIDEDTWARVRERDGPRGRVRHKHAGHWLEGLVRHACGARCYRRAWRRSGRSGGGIDFECASVTRNRQGRGPDCDVRPLRKSERAVELATRQAVGLIAGALVPWRTAVVEAEHAAGGQDAVAARRRVERAAEALDRRLERATELALSGRISVERFDAERVALDAERAHLAARRAALPAPPDDALIREAWDALGEASTLAEIDEGPGLAALVASVGAVEMGPTGVRVLLRPTLRTLLPAPPVAPYPPRAPYGSRVNPETAQDAHG